MSECNYAKNAYLKDKYKNLSEEDKKKNMEKIDIVICLKKKSKN